MDGKDNTTPRVKAHVDAITHRDFTRTQALSTWPFWIFNLSLCFPAYFGTAYTFHVLSVAELSGRSEKLALDYFIPMAIVSVLANLFYGWISPRVRLKYLLAGMNVAAAIQVIGTIFLHTPRGVAAMIIGSGVTAGAFSALIGIVWPRFFGRTHLGAIAGINMSSVVIASGIGPLVFGMCYGQTGNYQAVLWGSLALPLILFAGSSRADNPQRALACPPREGA